jgi:hypothetical protein
MGKGRPKAALSTSVSLLHRAGYARAITGMASSCCSIPKVSQFWNSSTIFPPSRREIVRPETLTRLPVGSMPISSPLCVPRQLQGGGARPLLCNENVLDRRRDPEGSDACHERVRAWDEREANREDAD